MIVQTPKTEVDVPPQLSIKYIGLVEYLAALELQREIHRDVVAQRIPNTLLILEHPPVFTAGKRTQEFERPKDGTPVVEVDRGGRITWHGPGQLVGYPIIKLSNPKNVFSGM